MAAPVNISGIASNIDTNSIIEKLMNIEGATVRRLEAQQKSKESAKSIYEQLGTKLTTLKSKVAALKSANAFDAKSVTIDDTKIASATAEATAAAGSYNIEILQRSKATKVVGATAVSNGTALDLTKKLNDASNNLSTAVAGSGGDPNVGQLEINNNGTVTTIDYTLNADSIQDVITRINASAAGVTASYDKLSDRMVLTNKTGGDTNLTVTDVAAGGNLASALKLTAGATAQTVLGQYAKIKIEGRNLDNLGNPQAIQSADDVFTSGETGLDGLTITAKIDAGSTKVTVAADVDTMKKKFDEFITAYNDVTKFISANSTKGTGANVTAGVFSGDSSIQGLTRSLRSLSAATVGTLGGDINYLRGIGIGTSSAAPELSVVDSTRLNTVISTRGTELKTLLTDSTSGIMTKLDSYLATETTGTTGLVTTKAERFAEDLARLKASIKTQNVRLEDKEAKLRKQFGAMERAISLLGGSSISAMLNSLSSNQ
jgi:flagellar hook-associated protein 2